MDGCGVGEKGQADCAGMISGAVCGLVGITPASGFVTPMSALMIGFIAGLGCFLMVSIVKERFGYDDLLDVFGVHSRARSTLPASTTAPRGPSPPEIPPDGSASSCRRTRRPKSSAASRHQPPVV